MTLAAAGGVAIATLSVWAVAAVYRPPAEPARVAPPVVAREAPGESVLRAAEAAIDAGKVARAKELLAKYLATPNPSRADRASSLLRQIDYATSDDQAAAFLTTLTDEELAAVPTLEVLAVLPPALRREVEKVEHPGLKATHRECLCRNHPREKACRDEAQALAAQQRAAKLEQERLAREKAKPKVVYVNSTQQMLAVHESPAKYDGYTVVVSRELCWLSSDGIYRCKEANGYLFTWECGLRHDGAEPFGSRLGVQPKVLNYWTDTDTGIKARQDLKRGTAFRVGLTFLVAKGTCDHFGRDAECYYAILRNIDTTLLRQLEEQARIEEAARQRAIRLEKSRIARGVLQQYSRDTVATRDARRYGDLIVAQDTLLRIHAFYTSNLLTKPRVEGFFRQFTLDAVNEMNFLVALAGNWIPEYKDGAPNPDVTIGEAWDAYRVILYEMAKNKEIKLNDGPWQR